MAPSDSILNILTPSADDCCQKVFYELAAGGWVALIEEWTCPHCFAEYRPMVDGSIRLWGWCGPMPVLIRRQSA